MRSAARFYAVQALFQMEAADVGAGGGDRRVRDPPPRRRDRRRRPTPSPTSRTSAALLTAAVTEQARIDQLTHKALVVRWPIDRIDPTLRALFRAAGAELVATDTPPKVTINEYVDVAKAFYPDGKEAKFVNARPRPHGPRGPARRPSPEGSAPEPRRDLVARQPDVAEEIALPAPSVGCSRHGPAPARRASGAPLASSPA